MDLQKLFNHMAENHDLILLNTEMDEIIDIVKEIISDAQAESPTVGDNEHQGEYCIHSKSSSRAVINGIEHWQCYWCKRWFKCD